MTGTTYPAIVTDVFGTTTPNSHLNEVKAYLMTPKIEERIRSRIPQEYTIESYVDEAENLAKAGKKDSPLFRNYITLWDEAASIGYTNDELKLPIFDDARAALKELAARGSKIAVYSSSGAETMPRGMKTAGLAGIISKYYSQSQPEIGSKYEARGYIAIANDLGISVSDMIYVTDDVKEAKGAVSAGVKKVYFIKRNANKEELGKQKEGYITIDDYNTVLEDIEKEQEGNTTASKMDEQSEEKRTDIESKVEA